MRILIEEHQYEAAIVKDILSGIDALENVEGKVSVHYVGYYYNALLKDCVFILPKVLLKDIKDPDTKKSQEFVFGKYAPEDIINLDENNPLNQIEKNFLYKFAVWIYRAIVVYKNSKDHNPEIIYHAQIAEMGRGKKRLSNTYLDILLSLVQFNKDNQSFFFTIVKNMHSGLNKINWTRTINHSAAIIQNENPIYLNPINKKRQINFDEELIIIFFSILNYIGDTYGFPKNISCQYQLITGSRFDTYLRGFGKTRLRQIKYKYFSDKALQLWQLCFAFFDEARQIFINTDQKEYLLVKSFHIVFEAIIDELVGDNPLPDNMTKEQEDGKIVDHLYTAQSLIDNEHKKTYYIGDSKYYKMGHELGKESIYKQYTYARNVIQWNLDIFNNGKETASGIKLRDDTTEGYNVIPNFFVSAIMDEDFNYANEGIKQTDRKNKRHRNLQFTNRLFDRDTLLLFHYDVNFLFILSLYARNDSSQKTEWKDKIREIFRSEIQSWLQKDYTFYAVQAHPDVTAKTYIKENFSELLGKLYSPFKNENIYSLALDKEYTNENNKILEKLRKSFFVTELKLGDNPEEILAQCISAGYTPSGTNQVGVLMVMMEQYANKSKSFLHNGKLAIGIRQTKESFEILDNLQSIGYVLFHHRKNEGQHLYAVKGKCCARSLDDIETDRYINNKKAMLFVSVDIDTSIELSSTNIDCTRNPNLTSNTRYDAQYVTLEKIRKEV